MVGIANCIANGRKWLKRKILRKIEMETKNLTYNIPSNAQTFVVTFTALMWDNLGVSDMFNLYPNIFNSLRVLLVSPSTSGAVRLTEDATRPCYYEIIESQGLHIHLSELVAGVHRLTIISVYGTYTKSLLTVDVVVPTEAGNVGAPINIDMQTVNALVGVHAGDFTSLQDEVDEAKEEIAGKADGSIYQVGVSGEDEIEDIAKILGHGLEVGQNAVAIGLHAVAMGDGYAKGDMSVAFGKASERESSIETVGDGALAFGSIEGSESKIQAYGKGALAHGVCDGRSTNITATGMGSCARGVVKSDEQGIDVDGDGSYAGGIADQVFGDIYVEGFASFAHGLGVRAIADGQFVVGRANVIDSMGEYAFIVGNGTSDSNRSNAFAIDWEGNLVLFNNGTPVVLAPAKLAQLIA